ncbi:TM2 domain-containing protein almondex-like [Hydractinia symbiolongicarpus]|uniref:TM2 domain-containing protein almondex-like n=1 Tax=Hydractinia symbiolongicarpus TaxID=13093 RepID=UPI0025511F54|nr:TM2 domain-containing protein almondex-like [Hydractinia symbiolongicarpus]
MWSKTLCLVVVCMMIRFTVILYFCQLVKTSNIITPVIKLQDNPTSFGNDGESTFYCLNKYTHSQNCKDLTVACLNCTYNNSCIYGNTTEGNCTVQEGVACKGERHFTVTIPCVYCYQLQTESYTCGPRAFCQATASDQKRVVTNCTVHARQHCLGRRRFLKSFKCNWTSGYRWSTTLLLSITLGGFGVDRFYLGHWQEGLGKFFSFGGLGVWTLVDIVLVAVGYITPADGSLYIF